MTFGLNRNDLEGISLKLNKTGRKDLMFNQINTDKTFAMIYSALAGASAVLTAAYYSSISEPDMRTMAGLAALTFISGGLAYSRHRRVERVLETVRENYQGPAVINGERYD